MLTVSVEGHADVAHRDRREFDHSGRQSLTLLRENSCSSLSGSVRSGVGRAGIHTNQTLHRDSGTFTALDGT